MPKHIYGENLCGGPKKLILNYIGAALTFDKKIYIFLDSREMYFDYTRYRSRVFSVLPGWLSCLAWEKGEEITVQCHCHCPCPVFDRTPSFEIAAWTCVIDQ